MAKFKRLREPLGQILKVTEGKWLTNRSSVVIPADVSSFLSLDPNFWLPDGLNTENGVYAMVSDVEQIVGLAPAEDRNLLRTRAPRA